MFQSVPGTNQHLAIRVMFLDHGNSGMVFEFTTNRLRVRRATHCPMPFANCQQIIVRELSANHWWR